jgi:hypothetical protein
MFQKEACGQQIPRFAPEKSPFESRRSPGHLCALRLEIVFKSDCSISFHRKKWSVFGKASKAAITRFCERDKRRVAHRVAITSSRGNEHTFNGFSTEIRGFLPTQTGNGGLGLDRFASIPQRRSVLPWRDCFAD